MKHANISFFVPHIGCPQKCSFCDQNTISGASGAITPDEVKKTLERALVEVDDKSNCEIAFFGGSFTAINRSYMISLLEAANAFLGSDGFFGIRVSTRPDFIDDEILGILKGYGVTAIELGAQSMSDEVLSANRRGHTAADVKTASGLIESRGFELGLQMMTGLYKSTPQRDIKTAEEIIALSPKTVRMYPVTVIEGTELARLYESGEYKLLPFDEMVGLCAELLLMFYNADIRVIRCGLHASEELSGQAVAGYYHPAFKDLCEGYIYRKKIESAAANANGSIKIAVGTKYLSAAKGQKKANLEYFKGLGIDLELVADDKLEKYEIKTV